MYSHASLIGAFVITAAWDVVLHQFSEERFTLLGIEKWKWVEVLRPYFQKHTVLSAALVAGLVGAIAYACINIPSFTDDLSKMSKPLSLPLYLGWILFVSGAIGIPMRYSGLFPHLKKYYYDELGFVYSFAADAFSGLVVSLSMFIVSYILSYFSKTGKK